MLETADLAFRALVIGGFGGLLLLAWRTRGR